CYGFVVPGWRVDEDFAEIDLEGLAWGGRGLPAAAGLLHTELDQEQFVEGETTAGREKRLLAFGIVNLREGIWQRHELARRAYPGRKVLRVHVGVTICDPFGEAAQGFGVQPLGQRIDGNETARVQQVALFGQLVAAHRKLDLV